jgi:GNAT superfamily N-acetyltransferase
LTDFTVRRAVAQDAQGFVRAHEAAWDATLGVILGTPLGDLAPFEERVARFRAAFDDPPPQTGVWVAERDGDIVGIAARAGNELRDLYVVPAVWGSRVAKELMDAALGDIREDAATEAVLWVGEANARARRFYEREGWVASGATRASVLGPIELQYRRMLSQPT